MMTGLLLVLLAMVGLSLQACNPSVCVLPKCRCYNDPKPPGGLATNATPQIVMISFYGTINSENIQYYNPLFSDVENPNGCPARGTFFLEDEGTDYLLVKGLYDAGNEIGIHSVDGKAPETSTMWIETIKTVRGELNRIGIDLKTVLGVRAPGLALGDDDEMIGIGSNGMLYDSSCSNVGYSDQNTFLWPFTFDYMPTVTCDNGKAPTKVFPGKWEVMVADLHDVEGDKLPCVVPSACRNITTKRNAFDLFFNAFIEHYNGNRTPFNMVIDPAWAENEDLRDGTVEFLQYIRAVFGDDVWIVPIYKALQWVQTPTPIANLTNFTPWQC